LIWFVAIGITVALALYAWRRVKKWVGPLVAATLGGTGGFLGGGITALLRESTDFTIVVQSARGSEPRP
jgi:ABC-type uncharacterized transport system permease subunit